MAVSTVERHSEHGGETTGRLIDIAEPERVASEPDPKVALALAGWTLLQTDGMTDRVYVDAPDGLWTADAESGVVGSVREFAATHDADRVTVAFHPSERVERTSDPATAFE